MTARSRSRFSSSLVLRGLIGFPLLLLGACTIGIDDRPVPPEDIPGASFQQPAADYGAPAESAAPVMEAASPAYSSGPAYSAAPETGEGMVWRTGAQPAVQRSTLSAPGAAPAGSSLGEEVAALGEEPAIGQSTGAEESASAPEQAEPETPEEPAEVAAVAPADTHTFRLAPFVGLEADAAGPLREALQAEAEQNGYSLAGGKDALVLKGYLSSMEDNGALVLIYVWDVYDAAGTRLTRIDGQQKLPAGTQTEPLTLDAGAAEKLAARTIAALARWKPGDEG